ncbi:hypothetical protein PYH69_13055 [Mammaliicoccus lentus]|uniref:Uncharacterized protein n=1 Tax=Mammaliicoccus lentus TaxID=42858 RepID=A0AAX3W3H0_MAMLE|nr:hypothetical protein [Mammaliicoccus lentus]WHI59626.1 hypothetical protein PYH69_13055 [Mammaliicoccus lentus]
MEKQTKELKVIKNKQSKSLNTEIETNLMKRAETLFYAQKTTIIKQEKINNNLKKLENQIYVKSYSMRTYFSSIKIDKKQSVDKNVENIDIITKMTQLLIFPLENINNENYLNDSYSSNKNEFAEFTTVMSNYIKVEWEKVKKIK